MQSLDWHALLAPDSSWASVIVCPERTIDDFAATRGFRRAAPVVRIMRGTRCQNVDRLFQEWAAALQFPYYFGHNWDAFDECLADLNWLPANSYTFFLTKTHLLLPNSDDDFLTFTRVLDGVAKERMATSPEPRLSPPIAPFRVVFHTEPEHGADLRDRLQRAGVQWSGA